MAGLYIHVPFCKTICGYCDFYKTKDLSLKNVYLDSLFVEIERLSSLMVEYPIRTIYFGGGTPSLLQRNDFDRIFSSLNRVINLDSVEEITLEVNPDDFSLKYANMLSDFPVNRLSFGVQSVYDDLLKVMGRRHSFDQAVRAVESAVYVGFENVTVDLIYGLPGLNFDRWCNTVEVISKLPITHVSAYHLTYEEGTQFYKDLKNGLKQETIDSESVSQYNVLLDVLLKQGFVDYEISNFCKPGFESKHNSLYWSGEEYFGLGPSSHSFFNGFRRWNFSDVRKYSKSVLDGVLWYEDELLSARDVYNESVMLGLRQKKGLTVAKLISLGEFFYGCFLRDSKRFVDNGDLVFDGLSFFVSNKSRFITDYIIQELFVVE